MSTSYMSRGHSVDTTHTKTVYDKDGKPTVVREVDHNLQMQFWGGDLIATDRMKKKEEWENLIGQAYYSSSSYNPVAFRWNSSYTYNGVDTGAQAVGKSMSENAKWLEKNGQRADVALKEQKGVQAEAEEELRAEES